MREPLTTLLNLAAPLAMLPLAAALAWQLLSAVDFGYPVLYHFLDIDAHINEFGPENRYRAGFETTDDSDRKALFSAMLAAVNRSGEGLEGLSYTPAGGDRPVALLRRPEIEHLEHVATRITALRYAAGAGAVWLATTVLVLRRWRRPLAGMALWAGFGLVLALAALVGWAAFDPGGLFDRLHELAFPDGHQWFFFYQESLMTTLLKAPDLFGPTGAALVLLSLGLLGALTALARHFTDPA